MSALPPVSDGNVPGPVDAVDMQAPAPAASTSAADSATAAPASARPANARPAALDPEFCRKIQHDALTMIKRICAELRESVLDLHTNHYEAEHPINNTISVGFNKLVPFYNSTATNGFRYQFDAEVICLVAFIKALRVAEMEGGEVGGTYRWLRAQYREHLPIRLTTTDVLHRSN